MAYIGISSTVGNVIVSNGTSYSYQEDLSDVVTNSSTGNYSMSSTTNGSLVIHAAAGTATYQLPAASARQTFTFTHRGPPPSSTAFNELQIQPASGDIVLYNNQLTENPGFLSINQKGSTLKLIAIDSTTWIATQILLPEHGKNESSNESLVVVDLTGRDTWVSKAVAGTDRNNLTGFSLNGYGYNVGGSPSAGNSSDETEQYNDSTDAFTTKDNLNVERRGPSTFSLNGFGYATHGLNTADTNLNSVERYSDSANTWTTLGATSGTARSFAGTHVLNGYGYASSVDGLIATGIKFNDSADSWSTIATMNTTRVAGFGNSLNGFGYIFGGTDSSVTTFYATIEQYNDSSNTWLTRQSFTTARNLSHPIPLNGYMLLAGGFDGANSLSSTQLYDPNINSWISKTSITAATSSGSFFSISGYGYISCGLTTVRVDDTYQYN